MDKNIAVIGCGYWGKNQVRNFAELGALHTIRNSSPVVLSQFAAIYPDAKRETSYERILANSGIKGWVCKCGVTLKFDRNNKAQCPDCGKMYQQMSREHIILCQGGKE